MMAKSQKIDRTLFLRERTEEQPVREEPSADFGNIFAFDDDSEEIESISAGSALGMAMMKAIGISGYIDGNTEWGRYQRALSPGNALKAIAAQYSRRI